MKPRTSNLPHVVKKRADFAARRAAIVRHYGASQNMRVTAEEFGITRERVRQIVAKEEKRAGDVMGGAP